MEEKSLNLRVDEKLWREIKLYCLRNNITIKDFVYKAVMDKVVKEKIKV